MPPNELLEFSQAVDDSTRREGPRNVILGNGFSIAWNHRVFHYRSLYDEASFEMLSVAKDALFGQMNTRDFELVIEHLESAATIADLYDTIDDDLAETLRADAQVIRNGLGEVIASRHPNKPTEMKDEEIESARAFLANFRKVFTTNYDLLLYWVVNRDQTGNHRVASRDGFEWLTAQGPYELIWKARPTQGTQQIYYLHGALHMFASDDGHLHKLDYTSTGPLVEKVREEIESGAYPLIVTEGKSTQKLAAVERNAYLRHAHEALGALSGSLFLHGFSLSSNDDHIIKVMESKGSNVETLYVGVYGDPDDEANDELMRRARKIARRRTANRGRKLDVMFYDSDSASVWR